jgi:hypothetical protein
MASPCDGAAGALEHTCTTSEWIWRTVISAASLVIFAADFEAVAAADMARIKALRLPITFSRKSQSTNPRFRAAAPSSRLVPPFRVLKACTTHGTESKTVAVRISRPAMLWSAQPSSMILVAGAFRTRVKCDLGIIVISRYRVACAPGDLVAHPYCKQSPRRELRDGSKNDPVRRYNPLFLLVLLTAGRDRENKIT